MTPRPSEPAASGIYTGRPVTLRAIQYTGNNLTEVSSFHGRDFTATDTGRCGHAIPITTPGGTLYARCGWWIAEEPTGQLHAVPPADFARQYALEETQPA